jgi:20S proteasome alpha/beta subunit
VTICAAGINQVNPSKPCIIVVCDRKISLGAISAEGIAWKIQTIHPKWRAMYAGPVSPLVALLDAVKSATASAKYENLRQFARLCSRAYREERKRIIETEILAEYDIESYSEYLGLKTSDRAFFDSLTSKIKEAESEWNLLFLGFDNVDIPHIFVITEYGKIQYCDAEGFAAIGGGAWAAWSALSRFGFNRFISRGTALYAILSAKFAAEGAEGVGKDTIFMVTRPSDRAGRGVVGLSPDEINKVREEWNSLPRIPDGTAARLDGYLKNAEREVPIRVKNPLRGYLTKTK